MRYPRKCYALLSTLKPQILYQEGHPNYVDAPTNFTVVCFPSKYHRNRMRPIARDYQKGLWFITTTDIPRKILKTAQFFETADVFRGWLSNQQESPQ